MPSPLAQRPVFPPNRAQTLPPGYPSQGATYSLAQSSLGTALSPLGMTRSNTIAAVGYNMTNGYASPPSSIGTPLYASPPGSPTGGIMTPPYHAQSDYFAPKQYGTVPAPQPIVGSTYPSQNPVYPSGGNAYGIASVQALPPTNCPNSYGIASVQAIPTANGNGYAGTIAGPFYSPAPPPGWP